MAFWGLLIVLGACSGNMDDQLPVVATNGILSLTDSTFESGGNVTSEGVNAVLKRGICWNTTGKPTVKGSTKTEDGVGAGLFRSKITGLLQDTKYYYRAYATNSAGTSYGEEYVVVTKKSVTIPTITTMPLSDIELTTAECGGIVSANGGDSILRCGVCWDTNPTPTTSSPGIVVLDYNQPVYYCTLKNLNYSTRYYVRSFAVNSKGVAYGEILSFTTKTLPAFELTSIGGGRFQMGSNDGEVNEQPVHWVTLDQFKIGTREVTVELWNAVMPNSEFRNEPNDLPISNVSYNDVMMFITRLDLATNTNYRLPTEAEWEFVAGEGVDARTLYAAGLNDTSTFTRRAWYVSNADGAVHPVGSLQSNKLGVFDMGGNVMEWCQDWYGDYSSSEVLNPKGPSSGTKKVLRGGSFADPALFCRTSMRLFQNPSSSNKMMGFRIALTK